jgi:hypothetical protein
MGDKYPYPSLLGIDWSYEKNAIVDIKRDTMTFEAEGIKYFSP